jgi:hypothetical protein
MGPAFPDLDGLLREFHAIYDTGDLAAADAFHESIDSLGLRATDAAGNTYRVFNILFQPGGLLFVALPA